MAMVPLPSAHPDYTRLSPIADAIVASGGGYVEFAQRVPEIFRQAIDEVIDAPRTGRYTIEETEKTEKTYLGTKVEILLRNYLKLPKGKILDLSVGGIEVDIKNTMGRAWTIPLESLGHPALLLRSSEKSARCDVGLILIKDEYLNPGLNRDSKRTISASGAANIWWLIHNAVYPPNFWEILPKTDRNAIINAGAGTARIAALFERVLLRPISRSQVQALAQQHDYMKRVDVTP